MEELVQKDIINIINLIKKCHSKSMYNCLINDLYKLYTLANILNIEVEDVDNYSYKNYSFNYKKIEKKQKNFYIKNYDFNKELVDNYKKILDNVDSTVCYELPIMSDFRQQELVVDFLRGYDRNIYEIYKKGYDKIIYLDKLDEDALTFYGKFFNPYILIESDNTIFTVLKLVHELGHVYDFSNSLENNYNYTGEIYSHFVELAFLDIHHDTIDRENIKKNYLHHLKTSIEDLDILLKSNISSNADFRNNYSKIYCILEYLYGMILALNFYDEYDYSYKEGVNLINKFSHEKNHIKDIMELIDKYDFDIEDIKQGKTLSKLLLR